MLLGNQGTHYGALDLPGFGKRSPARITPRPCQAVRLLCVYIHSKVRKVTERTGAEAAVAIVVVAVPAAVAAAVWQLSKRTSRYCDLGNPCSTGKL